MRQLIPTSIILSSAFLATACVTVVEAPVNNTPPPPGQSFASASDQLETDREVIYGISNDQYGPSGWVDIMWERCRSSRKGIFCVTHCEGVLKPTGSPVGKGGIRRCKATWANNHFHVEFRRSDEVINLKRAEWICDGAIPTRKRTNLGFGVTHTRTSTDGGEAQNVYCESP